MARAIGAELAVASVAGSSTTGFGFPQKPLPLRGAVGRAIIVVLAIFVFVYPFALLCSCFISGRHFASIIGLIGPCGYHSEASHRLAVDG